MRRSLEEKLLHPRAGSKAAAAKEFGIDLSLLLRQLRLTPEQRLNELQEEMELLDSLTREIAKSRKLRLNGEN